MSEAAEKYLYSKGYSQIGIHKYKDVLTDFHREQLEKITDQVKEAIKVFEDNKEVFPRTNTQDIIDMLKRLLNQLKQDEERNPK